MHGTEKTGVLFVNYKDKNVPEVVIKRLPRYYRYLGDILRSGTARISSAKLSDKMNVTASQIRQDFNYFGGFGQQGYGYNVEYLYNEIAELLGLKEGYKAVIIGAGHLGLALVNHASFEKRGFVITALFDNDPDKIGKTVNQKPIYNINDIEKYIRNNGISIAILALPKKEVGTLAENLANYGIKGLWNFSSAEIKTSKPVVIENVHMSDSLMTLSYKIKQGETENA